MHGCGKVSSFNKVRDTLRQKKREQENQYEQTLRPSLAGGKCDGEAEEEALGADRSQ